MRDHLIGLQWREFDGEICCYVYRKAGGERDRERGRGMCATGIEKGSVYR